MGSHREDAATRSEDWPPSGERVRSAEIEPAIRPYDREAEIETAIALVAGNTMVTRHRLAATYQLAAFLAVAGIEGAFVECGTWKGGAAGVMGLASLRHDILPRKLHLFDSFVDMCVPDSAIDGELAVHQARELSTTLPPLDGSLTPMPGFYDSMGGHGTIDEVRSLFDRLGYPSNDVVVHEGWFQDTIAPARAEIESIALLRLDTDFYAGTRCCLEGLFDLVVEGGVVIFDDYGCYDGCRLAVDEFLGNVRPSHFLNHIDAEGRYLIKR
jgi:O-methyltransferase